MQIDVKGAPPLPLGQLPAGFSVSGDASVQATLSGGVAIGAISPVSVGVTAIPAVSVGVTTLPDVGVNVKSLPAVNVANNNGKPFDVGATVHLDPVQLAPFTLSLQPGITMRFLLFGFTWLPLFSLEIKGRASVA